MKTFAEMTAEEKSAWAHKLGWRPRPKKKKKSPWIIPQFRWPNWLPKT